MTAAANGAKRRPTGRYRAFWRPFASTPVSAMSSLGTHALGIDTDDDRIVEALARRVVELLRAESAVAGDEWMDCKEVARRFGLSRDWVYAHFGTTRRGAARRRAAGAAPAPNNFKRSSGATSGPGPSPHPSRSSRCQPERALARSAPPCHRLFGWQSHTTVDHRRSTLGGPQVDRREEHAATGLGRDRAAAGGRRSGVCGRSGRGGTVGGARCAC
jgi:hypothetical protein